MIRIHDAAYPIFRITLLLLLMLISTLVYAQRPEGIKRVEVKARHYLFLSDTVYYCDKKTVFNIPESTPYKIRRYPTPFMKRKYPAMVWNKIYREFPSHPEKEDTLYNVKSESPYASYEGRRIAGFVITRLDAFGGSMHDTLYIEKHRIERWGEKIHISTKTWVVWNNLFIKHDSIIEPYRLADNERVLRSLYYMHDARIYVKEMEGTDLVMIEVITQDVWTIGLVTFANSAQEVESRLYDRNLLGMGQSVMLKTQYNYTTAPQMAVSFSYQKDNLWGTFVSPGFRISTVNDGVRQGGEYEGNITAFAGRPLFTPTTRFTGNAEYSYNWSINKKQKEDSLFYQYAYGRTDVWAGYTFEQLFKHDKKWANNHRYRFMIAARIIYQNFYEQPRQDLSKNYLFHDQLGYIGQVAWFHYNYYKTRYLLGFGRTEDVPYGYNLSFNVGVQKILNEVRPYTGAQFSLMQITPKGSLWISSVYLSAYYQEGIQDGLAAYNGSYYSSLHRIGGMKFRQYVAAGYAILYNTRFANGLSINDLKGISGLNSSLRGAQTAFIKFQGTVYPHFKMVGFRFAFFMSLNVAQVAPTTAKLLFNNRLYTGLGLGFRTRNENLIFDEVEVTFHYFPVVPNDSNYFGLTLTTNPKLVFDMGTVRPPSFVTY